MISIGHLYNIVEEDRKKLFGFFQKIDEKHFYFSPDDSIWSSELIFRHLLMNIKWMLDKLPGEQIEESTLAFDLDERISTQHTLQDIIREFNEFSPLLYERLSSLSNEDEEKHIDMWRGKMQLRIYLIRLINHEHRHLGQIQWLLKRSTSWTDKEIYGE